MAEQTHQEVETLNDKLGSLPYRLEVVSHAKVKYLDKNANYMTDEQFARLKNNVGKDGALTSVPLCYEDDDGKYVILSGNHRVMAAEKSGIPEFLVMVLKEKPSRQEQIAIQLSHNAIHGQDDKQILKQLWAEIEDLSLKMYSGLSTKEIEELEKASFDMVKEQPVKFEEISLLFLPEEIEVIKKTLEAIKGHRTTLAGRIDEFEDVLDGIMAVKQNQDIINSSIAFMELAKAVQEYREGKIEIKEALEDGVGTHIPFVIGGTKFRLKKETGQHLRAVINDGKKEGKSIDQVIEGLLFNPTSASPA